MGMKPGYIPPRSPHGLIQEDLWSPKPESEWMILVSCMMLNLTSRSQVEKVLPTFVLKWPKPSVFIVARHDDVSDTLKSLGFKNRRTKNMFMMTEAFLGGKWTHASELPGIGVYGARAWEMFCDGKFGDDPPGDGALRTYWSWVRKHGYDRS